MKFEFIPRLVEAVNKNVVHVYESSDPNLDPELHVASKIANMLKISTPLDMLNLYREGYFIYSDDITKSALADYFNPNEYPQSADATFIFRTGDCEDIARAQWFIAKSIGIDPYVAIIIMDVNGELYGHAFSVYFFRGKAYLHDYNTMYETDIKETADKTVRELISQYADETPGRVIEYALYTFSPWKGTYDNRYIPTNIGYSRAVTNLYFEHSESYVDPGIREIKKYVVNWRITQSTTTPSNKELVLYIILFLVFFGMIILGSID